MKITFEAILTLSKESQVRFKEPLEYVSPNGIKVSIRDHEDGPGKLVATYMVEADNAESVQPLIESEISRTASFLSWKRNMPVQSGRINSYQFSREEGTHGTVVLAESIGMTVTMSIIATYSKEAVESMATEFSKELSPEAEEIIAAWREAVSKDTEFERYIFLYRLLESLGISGGVDAWLKNADATAPKAKDQGRDVSIYKYLRDHVHPKKGLFPAQEIKDRLPGLQDLVRTAITQVYPELTL